MIRRAYNGGMNNAQMTATIPSHFAAHLTLN